MGLYMGGGGGGRRRISIFYLDVGKGSAASATLCAQSHANLTVCGRSKAHGASATCYDNFQLVSASVHARAPW